MIYEPRITIWPGSPHLQLILNNPITHTSLNVQIANSNYLKTDKGDKDRIMHTFPDLSIYAYKSIRVIKKEGDPTEAPHIEEIRKPLDSLELMVLHHLFTPQLNQMEEGDKALLASALNDFFQEMGKINEVSLDKPISDLIPMYFTRDVLTQNFKPVNMEAALQELEGTQRRLNQEKK